MSSSCQRRFQRRPSSKPAPAAINSDVRGRCRTNCSHAPRDAVDLFSTLFKVFRGSFAHLPEPLLSSVPHGFAHFLNVFSHFFRLLAQLITNRRHGVPLPESVCNQTQFSFLPLPFSWCWSLLRARRFLAPRLRGFSCSLGLTRLRRGPFHVLLWLRSRSIHSRLGRDPVIWLGGLVDPRRDVVLGERVAGPRHNRRPGKSHSARREFIAARSGWTSRRIAFQPLPLLAESLDFLPLLRKPLSLCLVHRLESQPVVLVPSQLVKRRAERESSLSCLCVV